MRTAALSVLLCVLATPCANASDPEGPKRRKVAILPVMDFARTTEQLWTRPKKAPKKSTVEQALERYLTKRLAVEPHIDVISPRDVRKRLRAIKTHSVGSHLGLERMRLGLDLYKELRVKEAVPHLEQAHTALVGAFFPLVDPNTMSELALTLALCYMERKDTHRAHIALKQMFHWAPRRTFKRGFYSRAFEEALVRALVDFTATYPRENPFGTEQSRNRFAQDIDVDALIIAYLEPAGGGGKQVRIMVYDRHTRNTTFRGSFVSTERTTDLERIDRFVSRWATCLPTEVIDPDQKPKPSAFSAFYLETSFAYSVFGSHASDTAPTRDPFHNLGMSITAEWQFLSGLGAWVQTEMLISTQDPRRDLVDNLTTVKAAAGVGYGFKRNWWRIFARFGIELQHLSSFETLTDPWCKYDDGHPKCLGSTEPGQSFESSNQLGFYAAVGFQTFISHALYWSIRAAVSGYIVAFEDDAPHLNFPVTISTGLGYTF